MSEAFICDHDEVEIQGEALVVKIWTQTYGYLADKNEIRHFHGYPCLIAWTTERHNEKSREAREARLEQAAGLESQEPWWKRWFP